MRRGGTRAWLAATASAMAMAVAVPFTVALVSLSATEASEQRARRGRRARTGGHDGGRSVILPVAAHGSVRASTTLQKELDHLWKALVRGLRAHGRVEGQGSGEGSGEGCASSFNPDSSRSDLRGGGTASHARRWR